MKLSIITINFNEADGLRRTIHSVAKQNFTDIEYLIIDGASNDHSLQIIEKFKEYVDYWISEIDHGIYNAMNKGIQAAKGEYLLFLNSGDLLINKNILSDVFNFHYKEDILYGDIIERYPDGREKLQKSLNPEEMTLLNFYTNNRATIQHPAAFIKRSLFENGNYDENYKIIADIKFFIDQIVFKNCTIRYLSQPISIFYMDGTSSQPENWSKTIKERNSIFKELLPPKIYIDYEKFIIIKDSPILDYLPLIENTTRLKKIVLFFIKSLMKIHKVIYPDR